MITKRQLKAAKHFDIRELNYRGDLLWTPEVLKNTSYDLLVMMDHYRTFMGCPVLVHCFWEWGGHVHRSKHYSGDACDFRLITELSYSEQVFFMLEFVRHSLCPLGGFGVGFYPESKTNFMHIDLRVKNAVWYQKNGEYIRLTDTEDQDVVSTIRRYENGVG